MLMFLVRIFVSVCLLLFPVIRQSGGNGMNTRPRPARLSLSQCSKRNTGLHLVSSLQSKLQLAGIALMSILVVTPQARSEGHILT